LKQSSSERDRHQDRVRNLRALLDDAGIPHLDNPSHIVPVMVGDPITCRHVSDALLSDFGIYVQPINYPTVPRGTERLRITPSPLHSDDDLRHLVQSLSSIWSTYRLHRTLPTKLIPGSRCPLGYGFVQEVAACPNVDLARVDPATRTEADGELTR